MEYSLIFKYRILFVIFFLTACIAQSNQNQVLSTVSPDLTQTPTNTKVPTPTITLTPRSTAEATVQALGEICEYPAIVESQGSVISPNRDWIAVNCQGKNDLISSYLTVINVKDDKNWNIRFVDYSLNGYYDRRESFYPFHWSKDGKYLFAKSINIGSGCCWIGWDLILVRLNLETGEQVEIARYAGISGTFSISSNDKYVLYTPYDELRILDLYTRKEKIIKLGIERSGSAGYAILSPDEKKVILIFREYPKEQQGDLTFGSIVLIDIENGSQKRLLSGIDYDETPIPVSWQDDENVFLQKSNVYWLINIKTAEMIEVEKP